MFDMILSIIKFLLVVFITASISISYKKDRKMSSYN